MNKAKRYSQRLEKLRWLWCLPAAVMYAATQVPFGQTAAFVLAVVFGVAFYLICSRGRMHVISEDIVRDIRDTLKRFGHEDSVYEIKGFTFGLVVRVYLFKAKLNTPTCTKAIMDRLSRGWYKNMVWVAQIVDIEEESQLRNAQKDLDQALLDTLERERGKK